MKDIIIDALVDLYQNGPRDTVLGLCSHIGDFVADETKELSEADGARTCRAVHELLDGLFRRWPMFSGDLDYPVPGVEGMTSRSSFLKIREMWAGEYGAKRWSLAEFLLRELCK